MEFQKTSKLLCVEGDPKTIKGKKRNYLTGVLYLSPANLSGFQVCPKATEGCKLVCLNTAGRGIYTRTQQSRINKTRWFFLDRTSFMDQLIKDIKRVVRKAKKYGMKPCVRLNGTSDIAWEKMKVLKDGVVYRNIMEAFPNVKFYDYSKILGRNIKDIKNYSLTFSLSENNDKAARAALDQGYNLAVVMRLKRKDKKPSMWSGFPVIDGDKDDLRFLDKKGGQIVGLFPKGKARYDTSGFVKDLNYKLDN